MTGDRLQSLAKGDTVTRRTEVDSRPGWLPVRTQAGRAGWIGLVHLRSVEAALAAAATNVVSDAAGAAATRIDPTWAKPPIVQSTILVQGGKASCGSRGDGTDDGTNFHKNRADAPASSHLVTVDAIRSLPDTALWRFTNRRHWTAADSALVVPYEGIPVTVEGYFEIVKPQRASPPGVGKRVGESVNCHSWDEDDTDWHIALVADPSETEEQAVVVEPTPRTKRNHAGWDPEEAAKLAVRRTPDSPRNEAGAARVRVTGFLMLDPVHPAHIRGNCKANCSERRFFRATLWEIHPVTRIEVFRGGRWTELGPP
jgi:hypothetical protein